MVESAQAGLPLVLLTADRAPESRLNGANQAITQPQIFGGYTRFAVDMPCPTDELPAQYVLEQVDQAVYAANYPIPGPVQVRGGNDRGFHTQPNDRRVAPPRFTASSSRSPRNRMPAISTRSSAFNVHRASNDLFSCFSHPPAQLYGEG